MDTPLSETGGPSPATNSVSEKLAFLGTVRGRLGWAAGTWLFYGSGGVAYGNVNSTVSFDVPANPLAVAGAHSVASAAVAASGGINYVLTPSCVLGVRVLHH